jgi:hypothetical protein
MKTIKNKTSLRQAIDAKCKDCTYDPYADGRWREQIAACTVTKCPLWSVRPKSYQKVELVNDPLTALGENN